MTINIYSYESIHQLLVDSINKNDITLIAGNGGFAAMADHFAGELIPLGYPVIAMNSLAAITAISNDFGYEQTIWRYVKAFKPKNLILLTTSGTSKNIIDTLEHPNPKWSKAENIFLITSKQPDLFLPSKKWLEQTEKTSLNIYNPIVMLANENNQAERTARLQEATLTLLHNVYLTLKEKE